MGALAIAEPESAVGPLKIFGSVPAWAIAHAMDDDSMAPLLRYGEVAVVESMGQKGWYPVQGALFLIEYISAPQGDSKYERRQRAVVQTNCRALPSGEMRWWADPLQRMSSPQRAAQLAKSGRLYCSDGPYRDEFVLADKLLGRVAGIYRPDWRSTPN